MDVMPKYIFFTRTHRRVGYHYIKKKKGREPVQHPPPYLNTLHLQSTEKGLAKEHTNFLL
jgi:hypothetical protein